MLTALPSGYLRTSGSRILGEDGRPVRLAGVNWYGFDCPPMVPGGLGRTTIEQVCGRIATLGFNVVRVPFCVQMVAENPTVTHYLDAEPQLQGKTALEILDRVVAGLGDQGIKVILDSHRGTPGWSTQENGLWYSQEYSENQWIDAWELLARRYIGNDTVIGCDLHNEPGSPPPDQLSWPSNGGSLWGYGDGLLGGSKRNWAAAATRAGNRILAANPDLLILVEGVREDPAGPSENDNSYWPGGNLTGVRAPAIPHRLRPFQVVLAIPNRLVYSVHDYGPDNYHGLPWCRLGSTAETNDACFGVWDATWGFVAKDDIAPVLIGEFGTPNGRKPGDPAPPESFTDPNASNAQGAWFSYLVDYIRQNDLHWTYWCINGTQTQAPGRTAGRVEWYGVLDQSWDAVASEPLMAKLRAAM